MIKIYNEIMINMNPESDEYRQTLYEDSFLYNGPLHLAQGDDEDGGGEGGDEGGDEEVDDQFMGEDTSWLQEWFANNNVMPGQEHWNYNQDEVKPTSYYLDNFGESFGGVHRNSLKGVVDYQKLGVGNAGWWLNSGSTFAGGNTTNAGAYDNWVTDSHTGIKMSKAEVKVKPMDNMPWMPVGYIMKLKFPDGTIRYKHFRVGNSTAGYQSGWRDAAEEFAGKLTDFGKSRGREAWGWRSWDTLKEEYDMYYEQQGTHTGFTGEAGDTGPSEEEKAAAEKKRLKAEIGRELAHVKQETEDVSEQSQLRAQQAIARQQGMTQRRMQAQLAAQSGMSPEETASMLAGGQEAVGRMQGDIISQGNILKHKTLADLAKFDVSAGLSAEELGTKLQDLHMQKQQFYSGLRNQFNIAQLQSDTSRYGMDLDYKSALAQAEAQASAGAAQGWGEFAGGMGQMAMTAKIHFKCIPEGTFVDTINGPVPIEQVLAGDTIVGFDGEDAIVMQKHEYKENPESERFLEIEFNDGTFVNLCDMHRMNNVRAKDISTGDRINGKIVSDIKWYKGVRRSYDLLTDGVGYRISNIPVNSMIAEMTELIVALSRKEN